MAYQLECLSRLAQKKLANEIAMFGTLFTGHSESGIADAEVITSAPFSQAKEDVTKFANLKKGKYSRPKKASN